MRRERGRTWLAILAGIGVLLAACSVAPSRSRPVVEVFGNVVGDPGERFGRVLRQVSAGSGVELRYVGVSSFIDQLTDRLERGDRPGVALLPQPGVLADLVHRGVVTSLPLEVATDSGADIPRPLLELATVDGVLSAIWLTVDVKGLVWYQPRQLRARELSLPATLDDLAATSARIGDLPDGVAPWCLAVEAGASTGWVGTDWVESYVLRRLGPDAYDRWTAGQLPFDGPEIASVFDELDALLRAPGATPGGSRAVLSTPWEKAARQLLAATPPCLMLHQADFIRSEFPAGARIGPDGDVDFFPLPAAARGQPPPLILGGRLAAPLVDTAAVAEAMAVLASPRLAEALVRTGEFLSPHLELGPDATPDETARRLLELVRTAPTVRFDGSDLMPSPVGTGTFWAGMRAFLGGEQVRAVLAEIQAGWAEPSPSPSG